LEIAVAFLYWSEVAQAAECHVVEFVPLSRIEPHEDSVAAMCKGNVILLQFLRSGVIEVVQLYAAYPVQSVVSIRVLQRFPWSIQV